MNRAKMQQTADFSSLQIPGSTAYRRSRASVISGEDRTTTNNQAVKSKRKSRKDIGANKDPRMSRRRLIQLGGMGWGALNLGGLLRAREALANSDAGGLSPAMIRSCIVIFYYGGPSHLDTFDMKPDAPREVRGEFEPISTSVPGLMVSEHLPHLARVMHKVAVVRSMHHTNRLHDSASTEALTGRQSPQGDREEFSPIPQFYPCHGATLSYMWRARQLPVTHAALPWVFHNVIDVPCQGGGFLGAAYDPFRIDGNPQTLNYSSKMFSRPDDLTLSRVSERRQLLDRIELDPDLNDSVVGTRLQSVYQKAFDLTQSTVVHDALAIDREPESIRKLYGMEGSGERGSTNGAETGYGRNLRGQNLLLARRLVEAEIPFVNVYDFKQQGQNWDAHADNFGQHKNHLLPPMDRALAALINDLDQRDLLDSTLVVAMGEFGRTPRINGNAGRDHWPDCYSILLAGGGIRGGAVLGASDKHGTYPSMDPVTPGDLAATIYWRFGLDPTAIIHDRTGRPHHLANGRPLKQLFS